VTTSSAGTNKVFLPLLDCAKIEASYGGIKALKGLTFHVNRGEIVSLIGANGAGKTTTLRTVSGLLSYRGQINFNGLNLHELPPHKIAQLGVAHAPEGRGVFQNLTVLENLEMGAYNRKGRTPQEKLQLEEDYSYCFHLFPRLKERIKQPAGTLSGGEQQMLAICRALMAKPTLLMLDEPSLGLAPLIVAQIFEIIQRVHANGVTILLVEQNARMALKISDRAYVLETGTIALAGTGADLLNDSRIIDSYLGT
jgi:branched-chain amino acid transport system ATP-binding protein